jgi:uncharacterized protein (DUF885 family)
MMMYRFLVLGFLAFPMTLAAADWREEIDAVVAEMQQLAGVGAGQDDSARFSRLIELYYDYSMVSYPEFATYLGDPRGQDRWTDETEAAVEQRQQHQRLLLRALGSLDRDKLDEQGQVNYDLLYASTRDGIEGHRFPGEMMPINQMGGPQQSIARMMSIMQPKSHQD